MDDVFAQYYEDLLRAQYRVSEAVQQMLPRGTIREDFLRDAVLKRRPSLRGNKGFVAKNNTQSGECDLILYNSTATVTPMGDQIFIEPEHCKLILEVKSNATGNDLRKTNENFDTIKTIDSDYQPKCGLFCYNTQLLIGTIFRRFGYVFDSDVESWNEDQSLRLWYPNIDFMISIACTEEDATCLEKQLFIIKDDSSGRFILSAEYPVIKDFFGITDNL